MSPSSDSVRVERAVVRDVRFPTSDTLAGSDAMNPDPDYSAAYVVLETDAPGLNGHGLAFTIGRGNDLVALAIEGLAHHVVGRTLSELTRDLRAVYRRIAHDSQLRWLGPEKGVVHLATAALMNAVWDLWARVEDKPLWKLLADLSAEQLVAAVDLSYLGDELTEREAIALLQEQASGKEEREAYVLTHGVPAYTTSAGWLGYDDAKIRQLCREAVAAGWMHVKMKVGKDLNDDLRRASIIREEIGPDRHLMMDANQAWDVPEAIASMRELARFDPWWIEEPTSPDDVLGHAEIARAIAPLRVATGEHCQNRVLFKQFLQAGGLQVCQVDACRLGGVGEVIAVLLLAAKFGVPVCPHAGGVGLCEHVQHLAIFDYVRVGASLEDRVVEYVDHLHEHFEDPVVIEDGRYRAPRSPGYSTRMRAESVERYSYPDGPVWTRAAREQGARSSRRHSEPRRIDMKIVTFRSGEELRLGIAQDGRVIDVARAASELGVEAPATPEAFYARGLDTLPSLREVAQGAAPAIAGGDAAWLHEESELTLGPVVPAPEKILCVGLNYLRHAEESGMEPPQTPVLFSKFANSIAATGDDVPLPVEAKEYDYEAELVAVIGRRARRVSEADALSYVLGYTNGNDVSARDLQLLTGQWLLGKTLDRFLPIGPYLMTTDEIDDPQAMRVRCWMNGELRQDSDTSDMIFSVAQVVSYASRYMTLEPGDVISTGTPEGVILGRPVKTWLAPGDEVEVEIGPLGRLVNRMTEDRP